MDRILKILLTAVGIFIAYIWLGQIIKSCNPPKSIIGNVATPNNDDAYNSDIDDLPKDDFFEETVDTVDYFSNQNDSENSKQDQTIDYEEIDAIANGTKPLTAKPAQTSTEKDKTITAPPVKTETVDKPSVVTKSDPKTAETTSISNTGSYAVHAGSFIQAKNADKLVTKLRNKGYKNAEKVVYDNSEYSTVVAGRTNDHKAATNLVTQLKRNGFDAIVVKRN